MCTTLSQRQSRTLQRNIIQNPKNDGHYIAITTQSGKSFIDPPLHTIDEPMNDSIMVDDTPKAESEKVTVLILMLRRTKVRVRLMNF